MHKQQKQQAYFKINDFSYCQSLDKSFKYSADMWNWYIIIETNGEGHPHLGESSLEAGSS